MSVLPRDERRLPREIPEEDELLRQPSGSDNMSVAEAKQLSSGLPEDDLKARAEKNEADRTERFRDNFERIAILTLWIVWIVIVIVGLLWVYHVIAPPTWWRLPDQQVSQLQSIVTGGILASIAGGHVRKRLH